MDRANPPRHVVIFGRPGSGKSSLAEQMGRDYGYTLVRTGEMLRDAVRRNDFLGKRVENHLARGDLVPDSLIFELLQLNMTSPGERNLLFDGFPRTMGQVPLLEAFEKRFDFQIECYLEIRLSQKEAVDRMTGRRICPRCGATYHLIAKPPKVPEACDLDGTPLEKRPDDNLEVVKFRQQVYDDFALPILDYYREKSPGLFLEVNGSQPFDAVYREAKDLLSPEPVGPS